MDFDNLLDWQLIVDNATHIAIALVLALPLGWNRERSEALGLRTIPLVCVAACGFILMGRSMWPDSSEAQARLLSGLITGIGFLGGGAIVKHGMSVRGTATAASIWNTAAIGAAVAVNRLEIAVLLSAINIGVLVALGPISNHIEPEESDGEEDTPIEDDTSNVEE